MGYVKARVGKDGKTRYTACYLDLRGRLRSAGTYSTRKEANAKWQAAEVRQSEGRLTDPRRGRQRFAQYVTETWLPNHVMEPTTRQGYTYQLQRHILPWFGHMRMIEIGPSHVREWITHLQASGMKPKTLVNIKNVLSAIFTTALNDQVVFMHPTKGVKTPTVPNKPLKIITPEQFDLLYEHLPTAASRLLIETDIETGLRWGELTELRPADFDAATRTLTISRAVVQVDPKFHPAGRRFLVKEYPKDKEWRRVKISAQLSVKLREHIEAARLGDMDLLFSHDVEPTPQRELRVVPDPDSLGLTEPNAAGRQYKHGTLSAYTAGKCRCRHCKDAFAIYRQQRRSAGRDKPRRSSPRPVDTDGHIPRDWFRNKIWIPACESAALGQRVRIHDLRHAHASWLLAGGADLQRVKERLGHAKISTTEKYLHTLPDADESTVDAFESIRHRSRSAT